MQVTPSIGLVTSAPDRRVLHDNRWLSGRRCLRGACGQDFCHLHSSNGVDDPCKKHAGRTPWYVASAASASASMPCLQIKPWSCRTSTRSCVLHAHVEEQDDRARGSTARLPMAHLLWPSSAPCRLGDAEAGGESAGIGRCRRSGKARDGFSFPSIFVTAVNATSQPPIMLAIMAVP